MNKFSKLNRKTFTAFTLAEVLIVLCIIGIICEMTIPSLIMNTKKAEIVALYKKLYSDMSQTTNLIKMDNGGNLAGAFGLTSVDMLNAYSSKMKFFKLCPSGGSECFYSGTSSWHDLNGNIGWQDFSVNPAGILADGAIVSFVLTYPNCDHPNNNTVRPDFCAQILVDVNGKKPPNIFGRDIYEFQVTKDGIFPRGSMDDMSDITQYCTPGATAPMPYYGAACGQRILIEGAMNY